MRTLSPTSFHKSLVQVETFALGRGELAWLQGDAGTRTIAFFHDWNSGSGPFHVGSESWDVRKWNLSFSSRFDFIWGS